MVSLEQGLKPVKKKGDEKNDVKSEKKTKN